MPRSVVIKAVLSFSTITGIAVASIQDAPRSPTFLVAQEIIEPYEASFNDLDTLHLHGRSPGAHELEKRCASGDNSCGNNLCCPAQFSCVQSNGQTICRIGGTQAPTFLNLPSTAAYADTTSSSAATSTEASTTEQSSQQTTAAAVATSSFHTSTADDQAIASISSSASLAASSIAASIRSFAATGGSITSNPFAALSSEVSQAVSSASASAAVTGGSPGDSSATKGSNASGQHRKSLSSGAIAGIVIGSVAALVLFGVVLFFVLQRCKARRTAGTGDMHERAVDMYGGSNVGRPPRLFGSGLPTGAATPVRQGKTEMPAGVDGEPRLEIPALPPGWRSNVHTPEPGEGEYYGEEKDAGVLESGPPVTTHAKFAPDSPSGRIELPG